MPISTSMQDAEGIMDPQSLVVEVRGLTKLFGENQHVVRALDGVDLLISRGEFVAIMGPSGSGKSTLLHLLGALDRPTSGEIVITGHNLADVKDLDLFRNLTVGFVFQLHNLIPSLTALENVEIPLYERTADRYARRKRAADVLHLVGVGTLANRFPNQLSGGQRQRVAVARALVNEPAILLADEPTGNLDSQAAGDMVALFQELNRRLGTTIVLVTHDPLMALHARRIVTLRDGRIGRDQQVAATYLEELDALRQTGLGRLILGEGQQVRAGVASSAVNMNHGDTEDTEVH
jgi:ABC-type lipoprotein export system ATPase subunit